MPILAFIGDKEAIEKILRQPWPLGFKGQTPPAPTFYPDPEYPVDSIGFQLCAQAL
jgi:hypothetical protein